MTFDAGRIRHDGALMHYSKSSNGSSVTSNWRLAATGDSGVTWSPESTSSVSFGSNSNDVSSVGAAGASTLASHADHAHKGVTSLAVSSNVVTGPITLTPEGAVGLTVSGSTIKVNVVPASSSGGGASVSYASNSNDVSVVADAPGASTLVSRADHVHLYRAPIDAYTLHATCGDEFGSTLNTSLWTRRTVTAAEETNYASGGGTWMDVDLSSGAASRLYLQTAPAGDFEIVLSYAQYVSAGGAMAGAVIIDSTGAGVAVFPYDNSVAIYLGVLSGYAYASFPTTLNLTTTHYISTPKLWLGLKKSGTNYSVRFSYNGSVWSPYSATSSQAFTVDRIGFGRFFGTPATHRLSVDRFNVI